MKIFLRCNLAAICLAGVGVRMASGCLGLLVVIAIIRAIVVRI